MSRDNFITIVGNLTKDAETMFDANKNVCGAKIAIAVNVSKNKSFYVDRVVVWNDDKERLRPFLSKKGDYWLCKGTRVRIMGELDGGSFETTGGDVCKWLGIRADKVEIIDGGALYPHRTQQGEDNNSEASNSNGKQSGKKKPAPDPFDEEDEEEEKPKAAANKGKGGKHNPQLEEINEEDPFNS